MPAIKPSPVQVIGAGDPTDPGRIRSRSGRAPSSSIPSANPAGREPATKAARLAFALASEETQVLLYHVIDPELATEMSMSRAGSVTVRMEIAEGIVNDLRALGESLGVRVSTEVEMGRTMVGGIIQRAERGIDLIVMGTGVRAGSPRLFLGPKVERVLSQAPCSVIVLNG